MSTERKALSSTFFDRHVTAVARDLLGKLLLCKANDGLTVGRIIEVEAYLAEQDPACHAARGKTPRNTSMFGPPGLAYVYSIHSRYCLNAVTDAEDVPSAVLIRAVEPLEGLEHMRRRRGRDAPLDLARGPGRLCEAFGIDRDRDGKDLAERHGLWIADDDCRIPDDHIACSPRIGVTSAELLELRYFVDGNRFVSGPRKFHRRPLA